MMAHLGAPNGAPKDAYVTTFSIRDRKTLFGHHHALFSVLLSSSGTPKGASGAADSACCSEP